MSRSESPARADFGGKQWSIADLASGGNAVDPPSLPRTSVFALAPPTGLCSASGYVIARFPATLFPAEGFFQPWPSLRADPRPTRSHSTAGGCGV
jgi:hypothetical protein